MKNKIRLLINGSFSVTCLIILLSIIEKMFYNNASTYQILIVLIGVWIIPELIMGYNFAQKLEQQKCSKHILLTCIMNIILFTIWLFVNVDNNGSQGMALQHLIVEWFVIYMLIYVLEILFVIEFKKNNNV